MQRQFNDTMLEPLLWRELQLQLLLPRHRRHRLVDPHHLVVACDHLPRRARLALIEQDEILDDVQQPIVRQHAVQQPLGIQAALVCLVEPLPFSEMLPLAGDRAEAGVVAVRNDQEGIVMEGMRDDALVHVVGEVVVETLADVLVDGLELNEDQWQAVDEADQIGAAVVVRRPDAGELQLAHGQEAIGARRVVEIDHPGTSVRLAAVGVSICNVHAAAKQTVVVMVVLHHRAADVVDRQRPHRVLDGRSRQVGIEPFQRRAQVAGQYCLFGIGAAQRTARPQSLSVPGIHALPPQRPLQMLGEGRLHQPVLAVDGRHRQRLSPCTASVRIRQQSPRSSVAAGRCRGPGRVLGLVG